ncbi:MAG: hypothetical protein CMJ31_00475, partial [Phycisphaerae bacterium]|nr:hypothetical protein [Phycisphaerae bacterium]
MFHRRLLLLGSTLALGIAILCLQLLRVTTVNHDIAIVEASQALVQRQWTPTTRGRILDRRGRVLAIDRPAFTFAVDFRVLTGDWTERNARRLAPRLHHRAWESLPVPGRETLIANLSERLEEQVQSMWNELAERTGRDVVSIERERDNILARVDRMHESVSEARNISMLRDLARSGHAISQRDREDTADRARAPIREQRDVHPILSGLSDDIGFALLQRAREVVTLGLDGDGDAITIPVFPGAVVTDTAQRVYPLSDVTVEVDATRLPGPLRSEGTVAVDLRGVGWHVLGETRRGPRAEDIDRRQVYLAGSDDAENRELRGAYRREDLVGSRGVEWSAEHQLRGLRGMLQRNPATGDRSSAPPTPGRDVSLTIDFALQQRVRAAMAPELGLCMTQPWHGPSDLPDGVPLNGAAVVIDVDTGEILAMVSTPTPANEVEEGVWTPDPLVNRVVAAGYPPGSIVKALMLPGAVTRGRYALGSGIVCTGHLLPNRPDLFRCWIYKRYNITHSPSGDPIRADEAIKVSCNIFFYELGRRLGPDEITDLYQSFGVGRTFDLGVGAEWAGSIGPLDGSVGAPLTTSDAILMAIGQGPVTWTPLHAADAYATLARGGVHLAPRVVRDGVPPRAEPVELNQSAVNTALAGLRLSVSKGGTGYDIAFEDGREPIFNVPGVTVWGKTGT